MRPRMLAALALVALMPTAGALYVVTPVEMWLSTGQANVGDTITLSFQPNSQENATAYAGRTLSVTARDMDEASTNATLDLGAVTLDGKATATLTWVVPAAADDRALVVQATDGEGLTITRHLSVGDAPPVYVIAMSGPSDDPDLPVSSDDPPAGGDGDGATPIPDGAEDAEASGDGDKGSPGLALPLLAAALVALAVALRRRA